MIKDYKSGPGFDIRKTMLKNVPGCLYVEVLVSYKGKVVKTSGMKCSINLSNSNKEDLLDSAVDAAKYKALLKIGGRQLHQAMVYQKVIRNQVDTQLVNYYFRYVTTGIRIKSFVRKGKRYTGVFDTKTGRFRSYQRLSTRKVY